MITLETLRQQRQAILEVARRYGAHNIRVFGSVARGDATENSDVDLLVRFEPGRSLFDHGGLLMDLQNLLGVKVDIISEGGMRERFHQHIMKEIVTL